MAPSHVLSRGTDSPLVQTEPPWPPGGARRLQGWRGRHRRGGLREGRVNFLLMELLQEKRPGAAGGGELLCEKGSGAAEARGEALQEEGPGGGWVA